MYKDVALQVDSLVQDCSNSSALAMELLQSFTKPLKYSIPTIKIRQSHDQPVFIMEILDLETWSLYWNRALEPNKIQASWHSITKPQYYTSV